MTEDARTAALRRNAEALQGAIARGPAGLRKYLEERDREIAQSAVDAAISDLAARGLLRERPAAYGIVKTIIRDDKDRVTGIVERRQQIEP